jgi:hypothetical protein
MGLDWRPMGKPKPGSEERFNQLFHLIQGKEKVQLSFWEKLLGKEPPKKEQLLKEWFSMLIPSYETIKAPRVGRDIAADEWLKSKYVKSEETPSFEKFAKEHAGYYVIELAEETDGVPMYISMTQDRNVFRGQFLRNCEDLIGKDLLNQAWETQLAEGTLRYGQQLLSIADQVALPGGLQYLKDQRIPPDVSADSLESKLHILYSAGKWLVFYGKNGHGYEADF